MIERHHDHIFRIASIADGAILPALRIPLDSDAPFDVRALGGYSSQGDAINPLPDLLLFRFADADGNWLQTARTPGLLTQPQAVSYNPLRKHVVYPPRGTVQIQLENRSGDALTNVVLMLRGVKYFPGEAALGSSVIYAPTYPECYSTETFQYVNQFSIPANITRLNVPLNVNGDADFVWRGGLVSTDYASAASQYTALEVRIRDVATKAYSSEGTDGGVGAWIRVTQLFGEESFRPGMWYPELYMEKSRQFVMDMRNVSATDTAAGQLTLEGAKIFAK